GAHAQGDVEGPGVLHGAEHEDLGADGGHLQHLLEADAIQLLRIADDAWVGGVDAVDVGVDLADVCVQGCGEGDGGGVRPTAAEGGDVLRLAVHPLETCDDADLALVQSLADAAWGDLDDACVAVALGGDHAGLGAGEALRV